MNGEVNIERKIVYSWVFFGTHCLWSRCPREVWGKVSKSLTVASLSNVWGPESCSVLRALRNRSPVIVWGGVGGVGGFEGFWLCRNKMYLIPKTVQYSNALPVPPPRPHPLIGSQFSIFTPSYSVSDDWSRFGPTKNGVTPPRKKPLEPPLRR